MYIIQVYFDVTNVLLPRDQRRTKHIRLMRFKCFTEETLFYINLSTFQFFKNMKSVIKQNLEVLSIQDNNIKSQNFYSRDSKTFRICCQIVTISKIR